MIEQNKLQKLLELMIFLSSRIKYTLKEITDRFQISERTTRSYIQTFRDAGFIIPKPENGRYYIDKTSPYFKEISELLHFSKEKAIILQKAIHSVNIHNLMQSITSKSKVILLSYLLANSKQQIDRIVEPFDFTSNYIATWAYDIKDGCCKIFRISSSEKTDVKLLLSIRAAKLLQEEYPLSEQYITQKNNTQFEFETPISNFNEVERFIIGLCDEIEVIYPKSLQDFIKNKAEKILIVIS